MSYIFCKYDEGLARYGWKGLCYIFQWCGLEASAICQPYTIYKLLRDIMQKASIFVSIRIDL